MIRILHNVLIEYGKYYALMTVQIKQITVTRMQTTQQMTQEIFSITVCLKQLVSVFSTWDLGCACDSERLLESSFLSCTSLTLLSFPYPAQYPIPNETTASPQAAAPTKSSCLFIPDSFPNDNIFFEYF